MKELMAIAVFVLSMLSVAQAAAGDLDAQVAKLEKALADAPTVKLEEQTFDTAIQARAIPYAKVINETSVKSQKINNDIAVKTAQIEKVKKNSFTRKSEVEKQVQPIQAEINRLKGALKSNESVAEPFSRDYQTLRTKYIASLTAKLSELKAKKQ